MKKSKKLVQRHIQAMLNAGWTKKDLARELGLPNPNYLSMLTRENYPNTLLSLDRIERFATVCNLSDEDALRLALARVEDAAGNAAEMSKEAFKALLMRFGRLALLRKAGA